MVGPRSLPLAVWLYTTSKGTSIPASCMGVTAVELLPVHQFVNDFHLVAKGSSNYWGHNTIGFLAPHNGYPSSGTRTPQTTPASPPVVPHRVGARSPDQTAHAPRNPYRCPGCTFGL